MDSAKSEYIQFEEQKPVGDVVYGYAPMRHGMTMLAWQRDDILWLGLCDELGEDYVLEKLRAYLPKASFARDDVLAAVKAQRLESGQASIKLYGTAFQKSVWERLLFIPSGETRSYGDIANDIGKPKAVRAVGSAVGANPVSILVPCHRVIHKNGGLSHYAWGRGIKKRLLEKEAEKC